MVPLDVIIEGILRDAEHRDWSIENSIQCGATSLRKDSQKKMEHSSLRRDRGSNSSIHLLNYHLKLAVTEEKHGVSIEVVVPRKWSPLW